MAEKVALVESVVSEHGVSLPCEMLGLARSTWYYSRRERPSYEERYEHLQAPLQAVAREHPAYGYRRTKTELEETHGHRVNKKVIRRLHRLWDLALMRSVPRPKPSGIRQVIAAAGERANLLAALHPETIGFFEVVYTDFTQLVYDGGRLKAWLIPVIGHRSKLAFGWAVGERTNTALALRAWERARASFARWKTDLEGMIMHHDQDPVFTSYRWTRELLVENGLRLSYALRGAKDNPEMESFIGRFKVENHSLFLDARTIEELRGVVEKRMKYYNRERRHSSLGNRAPFAFTDARHPGGP